MEEIMRPQRSISEEKQITLKRLLKETKTKADFQRVQCLWLRASMGLSSNQVADAVGLRSGTVKIIQSKYFKEGEAALLGVGRGGRRNENMSFEEEVKLLSSFTEKATKGGVLVVSEIKAHYERKVGHMVPKSTIYRMLSRHGWRKIVPRPCHPKADMKRQESFKKTSKK
jgi:transposase